MVKSVVATPSRRADQVGDHPNAGERQNLVARSARANPPVVLALRPRWYQPRRGRFGRTALIATRRREQSLGK